MHRYNETVMGYTVRVEHFRYTEWVQFHAFPIFKQDWDINFGTELYDHRIDPEENYNFHGEQGYEATERELSRVLRAGWRSALPEWDSAESIADVVYLPEPPVFEDTVPPLYCTNQN